MVRICLGVVVLLTCVISFTAAYAYADEFGEGSDVEPTGPVTTISPDISISPSPTPMLNRTPTADAGKSLTVSTGALVVLDGSGSKDSDGNIISYSWRQLSGPKVELLSSRTPNPSFSSGKVAASYIFQLTVRDSKGASAIDVVTIAVKLKPVVSVSPTPAPTLIITPSPLPKVSSLFPFSGILITALGGILALLVAAVVRLVVKNRVPPLSGIVQDVITHIPLPSINVQCTDQGTGAVVGTYPTNEQGQFSAWLPPGVYLVSATKPGYAPFSREGIVIPIAKAEPLSLVVDMLPLVP